MNIKDLLMPFGLALLTVWGLQTFFFKKNENQQQAQHSFVAPRMQQMGKPLNTEIDFADAPRSAPAKQTRVRVDWGDVVFSTDGASIERLAFNRALNGDTQTIQTVLADEEDREKRFFLLALNEKTPYYYRLTDRSESEDDVTLTYEAATDASFIRKVFTIAKHKNNINCAITVRSKGGAVIEPRLLFQAPFMPELQQSDVISSVVIDGSNTFSKVGRTSLESERGWISPSIFGVENRYFLHAMVGDDNFTQRAYYRFDDKHGLSAILEGPEVTKEKTWHLSFYVGPKSHRALAMVDPRLEKTLNYSGWLAPISKLMLIALNWLYKHVHNYGLAIIILTILIKLVMLPFTWRGEKSMRRGKEMSKKLAYVKQRYKDDPEALQREQSAVMRKYGAPMLGGCLPMFLQMPVFFALSRLLSSSFELHDAPMLWISDLSSSDPYYIFPVLVGGSMLVNALNADAQQRFTMITVALVLGAITANLSAGLALYLTVSTVLGMVQTRVIKAFSKA